jgi:hypothetical protein
MLSQLAPSRDHSGSIPNAEYSRLFRVPLYSAFESSKFKNRYSVLVQREMECGRSPLRQRELVAIC